MAASESIVLLLIKKNYYMNITNISNETNVMKNNNKILQMGAPSP